jgi:DNA ligase-1
MKNFKPMLAVDCGDVNALRFPLLASPKLDGVRAIGDRWVTKSRSLKPIPNVNVQAQFAGLPEGLDGELIVGNDPQPQTRCYRRTVSVVM